MEKTNPTTYTQPFKKNKNPTKAERRVMQRGRKRRFAQTKGGKWLTRHGVLCECLKGARLEDIMPD